MQKIALFNLVVIIIGLLLSVLSVVCKSPKVGVIISIVVAAALTAGPPIFFRKKQGQIDFDERDAMIREKSLLFGFAVAFGSLGGVYISKLLRLGYNGSVPISDVFFLYIGALITFVVAKSLIVLGSYSRGHKDGE
jgi:nitrate/nitrite transporter NarK